MSSTKIVIPVSAGELVDKITILEIKKSRLKDRRQVEHVDVELHHLVGVFRQVIPSDRIAHLIDELRAINDDLWSVEEELRACEARCQFDSYFVTLARAVYRLNDRRATVKRSVNSILDSQIWEEKSY